MASANGCRVWRASAARQEMLLIWFSFFVLYTFGSSREDGSS